MWLEYCSMGRCKVSPPNSNVHTDLTKKCRLFLLNRVCEISIAFGINTLQWINYNSQWLLSVILQLCTICFTHVYFHILYTLLYSNLLGRRKKTRIYIYMLDNNQYQWLAEELRKKHLQIAYTHTHFTLQYAHIHRNAELCQQLVNVYVVSCN